MAYENQEHDVYIPFLSWGGVRTESRRERRSTLAALFHPMWCLWYNIQWL